ncbi:S41 family peptidase [Parabacteroides sp. APC149_11_2_Y6]
MKHYKILLVLLVSTLLFACREENPAVFNPQDGIRLTCWDDVFESFWNGMNYSYAFWDVDSTDWDAVYREYKPRFQDLKFYNSQDSTTVIELFTEMTKNLIDHHYSLSIKDENGQIWEQIRPGYQEVKKREYYHDSFSEDALINTINTNGEKGRIKRNELKEAHVRIGDNYIHIYSYCIDNSIVYFRLNIFYLSNNINNLQIQETISNFFHLIKTIPDLKGIIIDTRNNGGGNLADMFYILSPLTSKAITFGYTRTKNGMGRLDYTPWSPMTLYPASSGHSYDEVLPQLQIERNIENIPIVALADVNSVSMGEITPMAICAFPNGCLIGERTWGGHGPLNGNFNDSYAGTFENSAFEVYTSTSLTKNLDGNIYEGIGLTPDIEALYNEDEFLNGNDTQLERAIQYINTGK